MPIVVHSQILRLYAAAVAVGLATKRGALLAGIPRSLRAGLDDAQDGAAQLLSDLDHLNDLGRLPDGSVPLRTWLANALALCGPRSQAEVFREVLALLPAPEAPGGSATAVPSASVASTPTPATTGSSTFNIKIEGSTIASLAMGEGASAVGSISIGSTSPSDGSATEASAAPAVTNPAVDWDVSNRTRIRITELLKDAQARLDARKSYTWGSTLIGTKIPVWLIQGADKILRQDDGLSIPVYYETPAEVCDALHGDLFMSYLAACSKYLAQVQQVRTHYQYMLPAEFEHRVNTILVNDEGFARRATLRNGQWASSALQSVYLSYAADDEPFVERLFHALEARGVATFYFPLHAPAGERLGRVARIGINQHDRVLLVCSRGSLTDARVLHDLDVTLEREAREGASSRLIPLNLDNFARSDEWKPLHPDVIDEIQGRVMVEMVGAEGDARKFELGVERLIRALKG